MPVRHILRGVNGYYISVGRTPHSKEILKKSKWKSGGNFFISAKLMQGNTPLKNFLGGYGRIMLYLFEEFLPQCSYTLKNMLMQYVV
jgi:hypothetical protein